MSHDKDPERAQFDIAEARAAWERLDAACGSLLAQRCKSHRPYMGCPLDCSDVENALTPEFEQARPLITAAIDEIAACRAERSVALSPSAELEAVAFERDAACAELTQARKDWDALLMLIAMTLGTDEDRENAENGDVEEFDPWHALRTRAAIRKEAGL